MAYRFFTRSERSFGSKEFGRVASNADCMRRHIGILVARIVYSGGMVRRKLGSFKIHVGCGERMLDALVLTNGSPKDYTLSRVLRSLLQCGVAQAQGLSSEQTTLSIHSMKNLAVVSLDASVANLRFLLTILKPCPSSPIRVSVGTSTKMLESVLFIQVVKGVAR